MSEVLDILLAGSARNIQKDTPETDYKVLRLSKELGKDVVFRVRALSYSKVAELRDHPDMDAMVTIESVVEPSFKDVRLAVKYGLLAEGEEWGAHGVRPIDLVRAVLLPGETASISTAAQHLSGYGVATISTVKKN